MGDRDVVPSRQDRPSPFVRPRVEGVVGPHGRPALGSAHGARVGRAVDGLAERGGVRAGLLHDPNPAVEGDQADPHVAGHRVEERLRRGLRLLETATGGHSVARVQGEHRGAAD